MPPLSLPFTISPRSLAKPFDAACARLDSAQFASSLWSRRLDVWTSDPPGFANSSPTGSAGSLPEAPYSFGVLETAQALGDFQSLDRTGRRGCSCDCQSETSISSRKSRSSWSKSCSDRPRKDYRATRATIAVTLSVAPLFIADRTTFCATSSTAF